jgi:DNA-directed RNA polymerase alpha subunit
MGQQLVATGTQDDDTPIETLDLGVRAYNGLKRSNIKTVRQLLSMRKQELLRIRNLTPQHYEEIRERLIACGFMHPTQLIGPFADEESDDEAGP